MVNGVSGENIQLYSYGNIQRAGALSNGRVLYSVIDSNGKEAGKLSIPKEQVDTFEMSYNDILTTAPKIQKYVSEHSSQKDISHRRNLSMLFVAMGGFIGAAVPIFLTRNKSTLSQILSTVGGIVTGLSAGFAASLNITTPPGSYKFTRAAQKISKLDIQKLEEKKDS